MYNFSLNPLQLSNPIIPISTFRSVRITKHKPLVLCDIDDTIIGYDKDVDYFYNQLKMYIEKKKSSKSGPFHIFSTVLNNTGMISMTDAEIKHTANNMFNEYWMSRYMEWSWEFIFTSKLLNEELAHNSVSASHNN